MAHESSAGNIVLNSDCYKNSTSWMWPDGTEYVSSYIEARGGIYPSVLFAGLQPFLREWLLHPFTVDDVYAAEDLHSSMGNPFSRENWMNLLNDHGGYLPVEIEAVPEGTVVPTRNVLVQVINTDPKYPWLIGFLETALQRAVWYPSTVATTSWIAKQHTRCFLEKTSDHPETVRGFLHDYGNRGVSSWESAALGGIGHLINFDRSDTIPAVMGVRRWYNGSPPGCCTVFLEHALVGAEGPENEIASFRRLLESPYNLAGLLTDTYDHDNAVKNIIGKELNAEIRNFDGLVIARCDSGDPVKVPVDTVECLMESFGFETNSKGYRVLPPFIRVVQGDGLTLNTYVGLYAELEQRGLAADNVLCGMGGGLLQKVDRDSLYFGMKTNAVCVNGEWRDVFKAPTGSQVKRSKRGRLALCKVDGEYRTVRREEIPPEENLLVPVFRDGKLLRGWHMSELIERSEVLTPATYYALQ